MAQIQIEWKTRAAGRYPGHVETVEKTHWVEKLLARGFVVEVKGKKSEANDDAKLMAAPTTRKKKAEDEKTSGFGEDAAASSDTAPKSPSSDAE